MSINQSLAAFAMRQQANLVAADINRKYAFNIAENEIQGNECLWKWLFICRRQLYRDRIYCGLKRDENLNVIRNEKGNIEFLEDPKEWKKLAGLNDDHLYQKLLLDRLHPMYGELITMLGDGDEAKGKDILRKKLLQEEYVLSTEAVEYARGRIFTELKADSEYVRRQTKDYDGESKFSIRFPVTDQYFELKMESKRDFDYEDKLADARLGQQRFTNWKKDKWDRDRAKIQIDFYCKEWIEKNGEDRFMLFDHITEDVIKPDDFKALLTRYVPFIPTHKELYWKYEVMMWGTGSGVGGNGLN